MNGTVPVPNTQLVVVVVPAWLTNQPSKVTRLKVKGAGSSAATSDGNCRLVCP